jgi:uncharacterized membrane protein
MPPPPHSRLVWIDLLRGVAVVGMIETHVANSFLGEDCLGTRWFHTLDFFNGLMAPSFLWIAGYLQGLAVRRAQREGRPVVTGARLRRLGLVALIGYLLHVPWHVWSRGDFSAESWRIALQVDILPCMAVSLAMLLVAGLLRERGFDAVSLLLGGFFVAAAPAARDWHTGWIFVDAFLNRAAYSWFPLFPWVGFCALGSLMSRWELSWRTLFPASLLCIALGHAFAPAVYAYDHPAALSERVGWLGLLITAVGLVSRRFAPGWLLLAGRESLFIYVAHLLLLYAIPSWQGASLGASLGKTLTVPTAVLLFLGVTAVCLGLAWLNQWRKRRARGV